MEYRELYIDHLGPFSVESAQQAVSSSIGSGIGSGTHLGSGGLLIGPDSKQLREANTIGSYEDIWFPFVCPSAGQATCQQSAGIGARVEIYPPAHVPGRGKYGLHCSSEEEEEVALSSGEMNREE